MLCFMLMLMLIPMLILILKIMCCVMGAGGQRAGRGQRTNRVSGGYALLCLGECFLWFLHKFNNSQYQFQWNENVSRSIGSRMWISVSYEDSLAGWHWLRQFNVPIWVEWKAFSLINRFLIFPKWWSETPFPPFPSCACLGHVHVRLHPALLFQIEYLIMFALKTSSQHPLKEGGRVRDLKINKHKHTLNCYAFAALLHNSNIMSIIN